MPRNQTGISNGESGLSVRNKLNSTNNYISTYIYGENDYCYYNRNFYTSLQDNNIGHPLTDAAWWYYNVDNKISTTFGIETKILDSFDKAIGDGVFYEYKIKDISGNVRAGNITLAWDVGVGSIQPNHVSAQVGDTSAAVFQYEIVGNDVILRVVSSSANWTFTALRRIV